MSVGERLKYARKRLNITETQVSERTGIGVSSLSEFENGKREPKLSHLHRLAQLYNRQLSFFLEEGPVPQEMVLWRKQPEENAEKVERGFLKLCEQYRNLEMWCGETIEPRLPSPMVSAANLGYNDAESLARDVRKQLGLGDRPGIDLLRALEEECGVKVFHLAFEPKGVAASTKSPSFGFAVLLNSKHVRWRRNFDLAHELFHLLTWDVFHSEESESSGPNEREEKLADVFAANLLMPAEALRAAVNRRGPLTYEALFGIAREFDVSVEALAYRIGDLYGMEREKRDQIINTTREMAHLLEDRRKDNTNAPELPERYRALAIRALQRGEIALGRFAEYMDISRKQAQEYLRFEGWELEENPLTAA